MPTIKGTASVSDNHALTKLLRSTKFPSNFSQKVNLDKVHRGVLQHFIEERITEILGFEDEIVSSTAVHLFLPEADPDAAGGGMARSDKVDPRRAQLDLAGFLGDKEAAEFAAEVWTTMLDAQTAPAGVPRRLVEKKKQEMARNRALLAERRGAQPPGHSGASHVGTGTGSSSYGRRTAGGDPEMNAFLREAARRAEAARAALAGNNAVAAGVPLPGQVPVKVPPSPSPPRQDRANERRRDGYYYGRGGDRGRDRDRYRDYRNDYFREGQHRGRDRRRHDSAREFGHDHRGGHLDEFGRRIYNDDPYHASTTSDHVEQKQPAKTLTKHSYQQDHSQPKNTDNSHTRRRSRSYESNNSRSSQSDFSNSSSSSSKRDKDDNNKSRDELEHTRDIKHRHFEIHPSKHKGNKESDESYHSGDESSVATTDNSIHRSRSKSRSEDRSTSKERKTKDYSKHRDEATSREKKGSKKSKRRHKRRDGSKNKSIKNYESEDSHERYRERSRSCSSENRDRHHKNKRKAKKYRRSERRRRSSSYSSRDRSHSRGRSDSRDRDGSNHGKRDRSISSNEERSYSKRNRS